MTEFNDDESHVAEVLRDLGFERVSIAQMSTGAHVETLKHSRLDVGVKVLLGRTVPITTDLTD